MENETVRVIFLPRGEFSTRPRQSNNHTVNT